jgi:Raf kinase inhibitor-like YbhB/YbcL family protein
MELMSSQISDGVAIPREFTCDGENISPELSIRDVPEGTASLALVVDDPDSPGGTWAHWLLYDLPPGTEVIESGIPPVQTLDNGAMQGRNDFDRVGYGGPCPPRGSTHRYDFRLLALDLHLSLGPGANRKEVLRAAEGHVLDEARLSGSYRRP